MRHKRTVANFKGRGICCRNLFGFLETIAITGRASSLTPTWNQAKIICGLFTSVRGSAQAMDRNCTGKTLGRLLQPEADSQGVEIGKIAFRNRYVLFSFLLIIMFLAYLVLSQALS